MSGSTALAVPNEYPVDRFNVLIPVKTLQEISPVHKVVVNEVKINPDPSGKDVYKEGESGELALTKKGLAKLMAAANIQVIDSRPIPPQKCQRCIEAAGRTKLAPRCGDCPSADDVAYQVTIAVPEPSGTVRIVKATKELRMEDERARMKTEAQFKRFFPYRTEHCESKALNRALREGLMVSSTYKPEELQKPFAVALVVPNFADPDMKKAMVQRYANGTGELFGSAPQIEAPAGNVQSLPDGRTMDTDTGEIYETRPETGQPASGQTIETTGHVVGDDETPPWLQGEAEDKKETPPSKDIICMKCQRKIEPQGNWTPEVIKEYSIKNYKGLVLCPDCQKEYKKANR